MMIVFISLVWDFVVHENSCLTVFKTPEEHFFKSSLGDNPDLWRMVSLL